MDRGVKGVIRRRKKKEIRKIKISAPWAERYSKALGVVRRIKLCPFSRRVYPLFSFSISYTLAHSFLDCSLDIHSLTQSASFVPLLPLRPACSLLFSFYAWSFFFS